MPSNLGSDYFWDQDLSLLSVAAKACYWATASNAEKLIARSVLDLGRRGTVSSIETWRDSGFLTLSTIQSHLVKCTIPAADIVDSKTGETTLHVVMENASLSSELIKAVHSLGIDANARDLCGRTPLHTLVLSRGSSSNHLLEFVKTLVELGASVLSTDAAGNSVFQMFPRGGTQYPEILKSTFLYLLEVRKNEESISNSPLGDDKLAESPHFRNKVSNVALGPEIDQSIDAERFRCDSLRKKTINSLVPQVNSLPGVCEPLSGDGSLHTDASRNFVTQHFDSEFGIVSRRLGDLRLDGEKSIAGTVAPRVLRSPSQDTQRSLASVSSYTSQSSFPLPLRQALVERVFRHDIHAIRTASPAYFSILLVDKRTPCDPGFFHIDPLIGEGIDQPRIPIHGRVFADGPQSPEHPRSAGIHESRPLPYDVLEEPLARSELKIVSRGVYLKEGDPNSNIACIRMSEPPESGYAPALAIGPFRGEDANVQSRAFTDIWRSSLRASFMAKRCDAECDWLSHVDFAEALTQSILSFHSAIQVLSLVNKSPTPVLTQRDTEYIRALARRVPFDTSNENFSAEVQVRLGEFIGLLLTDSTTYESPMPQGQIPYSHVLKQYLSTEGTKLSDGLLSRLRCPHRDGTGYCEFSAIFWARAVTRNAIITYNYTPVSDKAVEASEAVENEEESKLSPFAQSTPNNVKTLMTALKERHQSYAPSLCYFKSQLKSASTVWSPSHHPAKRDATSEMLETRLFPYIQRPGDKYKGFNLVHSHYNKYQRHDYPLYPITLTANKQADDSCAQMVDMSVAEGMEDITSKQDLQKDATPRPSTSDVAPDTSPTDEISASNREINVPSELDRGRAGAMGYFVALGTRETKGVLLS